MALDDMQLLLAWVDGSDIRELADGFLADVHDPEFRLEQLADFLTSAFDNFLPWAVGLLIAWVNDLLAERNPGGPLIGRLLPGLVRYGVNSEQAVTLFRAGLRSRSVAIAVASGYADDRGTSDESLRDWLCTMDLADWRQRFAPSPSELRSLLEFARPAQTRLAAALLAGDAASIPFRATDDAPGDEEAALRPIPGDPEPPRVGIWTGQLLVGYVLAEHQAEVDAILATGLPLSIRLEAMDDGFVAHLQLLDLEI